MPDTSRSSLAKSRQKLFFGKWHREDVVDLLWAVVLFPIWGPIWAIQSLILWAVTRFYVWGSINSAWTRCVNHWKSCDHVVMQAPHAGRAFAHHLAVAMGRAHRKNSQFFMRQLRDAEPLLAGYAFKCLLRSNPKLQLKEIAPEILQRKDEISTLWADLGSSISVGRFVKNYFVARHFREGFHKRTINDLWVQDLVEMGDFSDMPMFINLKESQVSDKGVELLVRNLRIESLILDWVPISDAGVRYLRELGELEFLSLSGTRITDVGLKELTGLQKLEYLNLENTSVTSAAVDRVRQALPSCEIRV